MFERAKWFCSRVRLSFRWTWRERWRFLEACLALGTARVTTAVIPFRRLLPLLRAAGEPPVRAPSWAAAGDVQRAMMRAARVVPFGRNCLAQAIAASVMLRRRGVPTTVFLGVKKEGRKMQAHAWLRAGDLLVTGGPHHAEYAPITSFGAIAHESSVSNQG